jgi:Cu+-exporting ATPase
MMSEEGAESSIPLKNLKPGNRIVVRNQELIPADSILVKGEAHIDYSFVSGESTPVTKHVKDRIFAGGRQVGSAIELIVEKEVVQSYLTELWNQDLSDRSESHGLNTIINRVSQYFTVIIISISFAAAIYWLLTDPDIAMNAFTSVLIVACPCALALTVPFTLGNTMRIFGRAGMYLKKTQVLEEIAEVDTIVFDKTGTITQNDAFQVDLSGIRLTVSETKLLKSLARHSSHPLSQALYSHLPGDIIEDVDDFKETPGLGIMGRITEHRIMAGSRDFVTGKQDDENSTAAMVYVSIDGQVRGKIQIRNKYRPGMEDAIRQLKNRYDLHLLSGDNDAERAYLLEVFGNEGALHFKQSPTDKFNYIKELKSSGRKILMIGDGLNDAGALKESDVGITIADNVYHFSPACDAIVDSESFREIPKFIGFTKIAYRIVIAGFILSFIYNVVGISFAASGKLTPLISAILMPLSSVSVVAFATLMTYLLARSSKINTSS